MGVGIAACSSPCKCKCEELSRDTAISSVLGVSAAGDAEHCICGNKFIKDAVFCRKCGRKRPSGAPFPPDVRLVAWIRRRSGVEADFGEVFAEVFGCRDGVGPRRFIDVLESHGYPDGKTAFAFIDRHTKCGLVGASDWELLQIEVEDRENEGLKHLRGFLKENFSSPSEAYKEMGKGEGDVLCEAEFAESMKRLGFTTEDPLRLFHFLDKDYSGEICYSEFKAVMRSVGMAKKSKEPKSVRKASGSKELGKEDVAGRKRISSKDKSPRARERAPSPSRSPRANRKGSGGGHEGNRKRAETSP